MPLISEAQKKALVKLCAMRGGEVRLYGTSEERRPWYSISGICARRTARALEGKMFVEMGWSSSYEDYCIKATPAGRAYIELLKEAGVLEEETIVMARAFKGLQKEYEELEAKHNGK